MEHNTDSPLGRAWLSAELRLKSFENMHQLWYICLKEKNKLYSQKEEARRFRLNFPNGDRLAQVRAPDILLCFFKKALLGVDRNSEEEFVLGRC